MAKQQFPDLARSCRAFLRHKDVLLSPRVLRSYNIQVVQVRHCSCWYLCSIAVVVAVVSRDTFVLSHASSCILPTALVCCCRRTRTAGSSSCSMRGRTTRATTRCPSSILLLRCQGVMRACCSVNSQTAELLPSVHVMVEHPYMWGCILSVPHCW